MSLPIPLNDTISEDNFQPDAVRRLHSVVMGEVFIHRGLPYYEELLGDICDLFAQMNMQGALTPELINQYMKLYNIEYFRSFWGTVAQNMEYYLDHASVDDAHKRFVTGVIRPLQLAPERVKASNTTEIALIQQRVISDQTHGYTNPVDFWIVCLIAFRMTVGNSEVYPFIRTELTKLQDVKKPSTGAKGQTIIPR